MKVGIVLVNYRNTHDTLACIDSIEKYYPGSIFVYVIENSGEQIEIKQRIVKALIEINYIINTGNIGFASACNVGIKKALDCDCDYIALINNDTVFQDSSLIDAVNEADKNDNIGIVGLVNYFYEKPSVVWQAGFVNLISIGITFKKKLSRNKILTKVDFVPGSSMVIKNRVFGEVGFLNDNYFAYFEDQDFCLRAARAGYGTYVYSNSKILHKVGKSSDSTTKQYLRTRNKLYYYYLNGNPISWIVALLLHIIVSHIRFVNKKESQKYLIATYLGVKDFFKMHLFKGSLDSIRNIK